MGQQIDPLRAAPIPTDLEAGATTDALTMLDEYVAWYFWAKANLVRDAAVCHTAAAAAMKSLAVGDGPDAATAAACIVAGDAAAVGRTRANYSHHHQYVDWIWAQANRAPDPRVRRINGSGPCNPTWP